MSSTALGGDHSLREAFARADSAHQGSIDIMQLQSFLINHWRLHFSLATASRLVRRFDQSKTNRLDLTSFLALNKFLQEMQTSLRYYDGNNDGLLTKSEVRNALQQSGFTFDDKVFAAVFQAFDPKLSGTLSLAEYVAMATALRNAGTTFAAFDPQRKGQITLDYNQWVYACAQVL